jgi:myo-inositol-1(or 4)-monophosphatase
VTPGTLVSRSGSSALEVARRCAERAGQLLRERFGSQQEVRAKGRRDFVTEADLLVQRETLELLQREYPDCPVLAEEATSAPPPLDEGWLWVVDPLDGTTNFSRGIPHFCFSIALCWDGRPVLALTYQPIAGEEFVAQRGQGTLLNGAPVRASTSPGMATSFLGLDLGYDDERAARLLDFVRSLWPRFLGFRLMGSAALGLAYAACGRLDVYLHCHLKPWDVAAGILLVEEAGGLALDWRGAPARIDSEAVVVGAPGAVREVVARAGGDLWR